MKESSSYRHCADIGRYRPRDRDGRGPKLVIGEPAALTPARIGDCHCPADRNDAAGVAAALTDMPIAANSTEVFTKGSQPFVAAICAATETAALYFTNGEGL